MRAAWITAFVCTLVSSPLVGEENLPYQAIVTKNVNVMSGPGSVHYPTLRLTPGDRVEVYRHDPDGWCAIRPPEKSFSLITASAIRTTKDPSVGEVITDGIQAWVGTRMGLAKKPLWQVRLKKYETVEILERQPISADRDSRGAAWYVIAPPSGEFRWVHIDSIQKEVAPDQIVSSKVDRETGKAQPPSPLNSRSPGENSTGRSEVKVANGVGPVDSNTDADDDSNADLSLDDKGRTSAWVAKRDDEPETGQIQAESNDEEEVAKNGDDDSDQPELKLSGKRKIVSNLKFDQYHREIEIALTMVVLDEQGEWDLMELRTIVGELNELATTREERAHVKNLYKKIDQLEEVRLRRRAIDSRAAIDRENEARAIFADPDEFAEEQVRPVSFDRNTRVAYDAMGWLNRFYTHGGLGPTLYAIQDSTGKVTHVLTPAPGINLERYLKQEIGVFGEIGKHPTLKLPHLLVKRVVVMQRHR